MTKRELFRPGLFSVYKWFWRNSTWKRFLLPNPAGFAFAHLNPKIHEDIMSLDAKPGVYEFAISKGSGRRYKVYIGESGSIRKRHQTYAKTGDHLVLLFDAALNDGCTIWRRCRYVKTKQKAVAWEAYFLGKYDYAWNAQQNQRKRKVLCKGEYSNWQRLNMPLENLWLKNWRNFYKKEDACMRQEWVWTLRQTSGQTSITRWDQIFFRPKEHFSMNTLSPEEHRNALTDIEEVRIHHDIENQKRCSKGRFDRFYFPRDWVITLPWTQLKIGEWFKVTNRGLDIIYDEIAVNAHQLESFIDLIRKGGFEKWATNNRNEMLIVHTQRDSIISVYKLDRNTAKKVIHITGVDYSDFIPDGCNAYIKRVMSYKRKACTCTWHNNIPPCVRNYDSKEITASSWTNLTGITQVPVLLSPIEVIGLLHATKSDSEISGITGITIGGDLLDESFFEPNRNRKYHVSKISNDRMSNYSSNALSSKEALVFAFVEPEEIWRNLSAVI